MKISASILKIPLPSNLLEQRPSDLKLYDRQETDPNPDKLTEPCLGWINNLKVSGMYSHILHHKIQTTYN